MYKRVLLFVRRLDRADSYKKRQAICAPSPAEAGTTLPAGLPALTATRPRCRSPTSKRQQQPVIWENQVVGRFHVVNNETGDHIACDPFGKPTPPFHPGITGVADTKERLSLQLKVRRPHLPNPSSE